MQFEFQNDNDRNEIPDIDIALGGGGVVVLRHGPAPQHTTASPKRNVLRSTSGPGRRCRAFSKNKPTVS
jgi:hypothetical protein